MHADGKVVRTDNDPPEWAINIRIKGISFLSEARFLTESGALRALHALDGFGAIMIYGDREIEGDLADGDPQYEPPTREQRRRMQTPHCWNWRDE